MKRFALELVGTAAFASFLIAAPLVAVHANPLLGLVLVLALLVGVART